MKKRSFERSFEQFVDVVDQDQFYGNDYQKAIEDLFNVKNKAAPDFNFVKFPEKGIEYIKGKPFSSKLYELLRSYEYFFIERGLKDRYPSAYCQIYYCFYLFMEKHESGLSCYLENDWSNEKDWIQRRWMGICMNSISDQNIKYVFQTGQIDKDKDVDAEDQVEDILFCNKKLRKEFEEEKWNSWEPSLEVALDWFLRRYNLCYAKTLVTIFKKKEDCSFKKIFFTIIIPVLVFIFLIIFKLNNLLALLIAIFYTFLSFIITSSFIYHKGFLIFKLLIPRLIGCIIVGYLPLILGEQVWALVLEKMCWQELIMVVIMAFVFSFFYLSIEIQNMVKVKKTALRRAGVIFSIGLVESYLIGVVFLDVITKAFHEFADGYWRGLFGYMSPKALFFFPALALLVGIFIQIIWEDKPITYPL